MEVLHRLQAAVVGLDAEGRIIAWSEGAEGLTGHRAGDVYGRPVTLLYPRSAVERGEPDREREDAVLHGRIQFEAERVRRDGTRFLARVRMTPVYEESRLTGFTVELADAPWRDRVDRERADRGGVERDAVEREFVGRQVDEREVVERARQQRVAARLGQRALSGVALDRLMSEAVHAVCATLDVEYGKVLELRPRGEDLFLRAGAGWRPGWVGRRTVSAGHGSQAGYTLARDRPVVVNDLRTETRFHGPALLLEHGVISGISTVIAGRDGPWGVLGAHTRRQRAFGERDVAFMQAIANLLASAIERDRFEREQRLLADASAALAASLDYETTLERLVRLVAHRLADWCVVDIGEEGGRKLQRFTGAHRDADRDHQVRALMRFDIDPDARTPVGRAFEGGRATILETVPDGVIERMAGGDPEHHRALETLGIRSLMSVPLVARGRTLGVLTLVASESGRTYRSGDLSLAEELARRAAFAVDNARLYRVADVANRAKSDFLGVMSHELRTPLNAIVGFADVLDAGIDGSLTDRQRNEIGRIKASAFHLRDLIDEILTFSRLESGRESLRTEQVDVMRLAREVVETVRPLAEEKGLDCEVGLQMEAVEAETDVAKVRRILLALLGNAISFTEHGGIELRGAAGPDIVRFEVRDTGIGIASDDRERIFDPFWQARAGLTRTVGGTGLGLTVARRLARMLGGDVTVESRVGRGSTFVAHLPRHAPVDDRDGTPAKEDG